MPNPELKFVLPVESGTTGLRKGPNGEGDLALDSADAYKLKFNQNGTIRTVAVTTDVIETVDATNVITAAESGKVFFLDHATEFDSLLPAPAAGLKFTFIVVNPPETGSYTISSPSANQIVGQVFTLDVNSATDPDFETAGANTITFVADKAVKGDRVEIFCNGTDYFAYAFCSVFDAITFTDV